MTYFGQVSINKQPLAMQRRICISSIWGSGRTVSSEDEGRTALPCRNSQPGADARVLEPNKFTWSPCSEVLWKWSYNILHPGNNSINFSSSPFPRRGGRKAPLSGELKEEELEHAANRGRSVWVAERRQAHCSFHPEHFIGVKCICIMHPWLDSTYISLW